MNKNIKDKKYYLDRLIFDELVQAKYWELYIPNYMTNKYTIRSWMSSIVTVISLLAILLPKFISQVNGHTEIVGYIGFGLVILSQITLQIFPKISCTDKNLEDMSNLRSLYLQYYFKLERLYINFLSKKYDNDLNQLESEFYELKNEIIDIQYKKNLLNFNQKKKLDQKTNETLIDELKQKFEVITD